MTDALIAEAEQAMRDVPLAPRVEIGEPGRADYIESFNRRGGVAWALVEYKHAGTAEKPRRERELRYAIDRLRAHPGEIQAAKELTRKVTL